MIADPTTSMFREGGFITVVDGDGRSESVSAEEWEFGNFESLDRNRAECGFTEQERRDGLVREFRAVRIRDRFGRWSSNWTHERMDQVEAEELQREASLAVPQLIPPTLLEWDKQPSAPPRWTVESLIPENGIGLLVAPPKSRKSIAAEHLSHCVSSGIPFLDFNVRAGVSWYIDEENGRPTLEERSRKMRGKFPAFAREEALARFHVSSFEGFRLEGDGLDRMRATLEEWRELRGDAATPTILVLDSLRRLWSGDEDPSAEVARLMATVDEIRREFAVSVLLVHHTTKDLSKGWENAFRGSGDFYAASDALLFLQKTGPTSARLRVSTRISPELDVRLSFDAETFTFRRGEAKPPAPTAPTEPPDDKARIVEAVRENPGLSQRKLRDLLKISPNRLGPLLSELEAEGKLRDDGPGSPFRPTSWTVIEPGAE